MAKKTTGSDMFLQFADVSANLHGTDTSILVEGVRQTGLSVRGALIWLIHLVEVHFDLLDLVAASAHNMELALCTRKGLTSMPDVGDHGVICKLEAAMKTGGGPIVGPSVLHYLPPIPLAAPSISLYTKSNSHLASWVDSKLEARIGFTTAPLDAAAYTEIAETWGW